MSTQPVCFSAIKELDAALSCCKTSHDKIESLVLKINNTITTNISSLETRSLEELYNTKSTLETLDQKSTSKNDKLSLFPSILIIKAQIQCKDIVSDTKELEIDEAKLPPKGEHAWKHSCHCSDCVC